MHETKDTHLSSTGIILLLNKCKHVKHNNNAKWTGVCCKNCTNVNSILHHVSVISVTATELHHLSCAFVHRPHKLVDELHCKIIPFIQHHQPQVSIIKRQQSHTHLPVCPLLTRRFIHLIFFGLPLTKFRVDLQAEGSKNRGRKEGILS